MFEFIERLLASVVYYLSHHLFLSSEISYFTGHLPATWHSKRRAQTLAVRCTGRRREAVNVTKTKLHVVPHTLGDLYEFKASQLYRTSSSSDRDV